MPNGVQYICYIDETGFYLGDATLMGTFLDNDFESLTSTWVPAQTDGTLTLIRTKNVRSLWQALGSLASRYRAFNETTEMDQTVHLFMPCGVMARFIAFDDLPNASTRCTCGDPHHWLVWYTDEDPPEIPPVDEPS